MWSKKVEIVHEPHCDIVPDDLKVSIPVCRDELREKYQRIEKWRKDNYEFERLDLNECKPCKGRSL